MVSLWSPEALAIPKSINFTTPVGVKHHIGRLDIAVHHSPGVRVFQRDNTWRI